MTASSSPSPYRAIDAATAGRNCPYCRFPLKQGTPGASCPSCNAIHHADCWNDNGGCAILGCSQTPATPATATVTTERTQATAGSFAADPSTAGGTNGSSTRALTAGVLCLAAALVAVAIILAVRNGGSGGSQRARGATIAKAAAPSPSAGQSTGAPNSAASGGQSTGAPNAAASGGSSSSPASTATDASLTIFGGQGYEIGYPAGWQNLASEVSHPGYVDTRWQLPGDSSVKFIADYTLNCNCTPEQGGAPLRQARIQKDTTYHELGWASEQFPAGSAQVWQYTSTGVQVIDAFFSRCTTSFAIAGKAPVGSFSQYEPSFRRAIASFNPAPC
jgi:hypothetical protein